MVEADSVEFVLTWIIMVFLMVGFIGNVLVIRIVHKTREMHTPTNYLLASMAVSDVNTCLLGPLYLIRLGRFVCKSLALVEISVLVSSITLAVLAVERYHALLKPFRTGLRLKQDNVKQAIACIWVASVVICCPEFIFKDWSETHSSGTGPWTIYMNQATRVYVIINSVVSACIPLTVILYCYGSVIKGLYFTNTVWSETVVERTSEKKKLVITFILATTAFFVGYVPTAAVYTFFALGDDKQMDIKMFYAFTSVVHGMFAFSLCCNPILYAFRSKNFREGFKRIILCRKQTLQNEIQLQ